MVSVGEKACKANAEANMPRFYLDFARAKRFLDDREQTPGRLLLAFYM
jgi:hypothetical protein